MKFFMKTRFAELLLLLCVVLPGSVVAWETGWLDQVEGFEGDVVGATVDSIEVVEEEKRVTIGVPKSSIPEPGKNDAILVYVKKKLNPKQLTQVEYEWSKDYENDKYGLVLKLKNDNSYPLRLYLDSSGNEPGAAGHANGSQGQPGQ